MTKVEELEKAVLMLEEQVATNKTMSESYQKELELAQKQLKDINKPQLTPLQLDDIQEAIEAGIEDFDFSDTGNFDIEYGIEYDGKVHCESHDFNGTYELTEMIVKKVHALFVEAECPEDELDTTEDDNHPVEKLQR